MVRYENKLLDYGLFDRISLVKNMTLPLQCLFISETEPSGFGPDGETCRYEFEAKEGVYMYLGSPLYLKCDEEQPFLECDALSLTLGQIGKFRARWYSVKTITG